ncbi:hypothetical protein V8E53_007873 [Lactarius tabidus]
MASLNRISKSGSDWNLYDLNAYNIQIQHDDRATFFGNSKLPLPIIDEELLTTLKAEDKLSDHNAELIHLLDLAMSPASARQSAVNDFTVGLLRQLGYVKHIKHNRIACTQMNIPSVVAREWRDTINDICLLDDPPYWHILLLIQEVKHFQPDDQYDPSASLIAKAIGAFDYNNRNLVQMQWGKPTITSKVMPGIIMNGTMPTFYKIPVTANLVCNVLQGTYPSEPTIVSVYVPDLPSPQCHYSEGMKPLGNRQEVLCCFEAFKCIIGI